MKKLINNTSLTYSIVAMMLISFLFIVLIGGMGYVSIDNINGNVSSMYHEAVLQTQQINQISHTFMNMRIEALRVFDLGYNQSILNNIDSLDAEFRELVDIYLQENADNRIISVFDTIMRDYNTFHSAWNETKEKIRIGEEITPDDKFPLESRGSAVVNNLNYIINYNREIADELNNNSYDIYNNVISNLVNILVIAVVVFLIFSLMIIKIFRTSIKEITSIYEKISSGDFTVSIDTKGKNEFGLMKKSLASTLGKVSIMIKQVKENANDSTSSAKSLNDICQQMTTVAQEVTSAIQEVAEGSSLQAKELLEIKEIINDFNEELEKIVYDIEDIHKTTIQTDTMISQGNEKLQDLTTSMTEINASFNDVSDNVAVLEEKISEISKITGLINNISEQTNLLALNAAIEAARAGEAGKGFAVVANEIRKLAEQSQESSKSINTLLHNITVNRDKIVETTKQGVDNLQTQEEVIYSTINSFKEILQSIGEIIPKIENANTSVEVINQKKKNISSKIEAASAIAEDHSAIAQQIAASSEEMNASVEEVASTGETLNSITIKMQDKIDEFSV